MANYEKQEKQEGAHPIPLSLPPMPHCLVYNSSTKICDRVPGNRAFGRKNVFLVSDVYDTVLFMPFTPSWKV